MGKLLIIIIAGMVLASCEKKSDRYYPFFPPEKYLPKETNIGKNTFGCVIQEKPWLMKRKGINWLGIPVKWVTYSNGNLIMNIKGGAKNVEEIIYIRAQFTTPTTITLNNNDNNKAGYSIKTPDGAYFSYKTDSVNTGNLVINRLDTLQQIISGTFTFKAYEQNTQQIVHVTHGRFDFKYPY